MNIKTDNEKEVPVLEFLVQELADQIQKLSKIEGLAEDLVPAGLAIKDIAHELAVITNLVD